MKLAPAMCEAPPMWLGFIFAVPRTAPVRSSTATTVRDRARSLWMLSAPSRTVVAVDERTGAVLGTAKMNPNHMGGASHIAGASFMVDPAHSGRGVGRALGEYVLTWARAEGYRAMQFNAVVETNTGAVALWKSLGFDIVATLPEGFLHPSLGYVGLHIMYQQLV
jgi:GNAT superfamily N-acetyltransferase